MPRRDHLTAAEKLDLSRPPDARPASMSRMNSGREPSPAAVFHASPLRSLGRELRNVQLQRLRRIFLPVLLLRRHRVRRAAERALLVDDASPEPGRNVPPTERAIFESAVRRALRSSSTSELMRWPEAALAQLASEARHGYALPGETLLYRGEPAWSAGVVIILRGAASWSERSPVAAADALEASVLDLLPFRRPTTVSGGRGSVASARQGHRPSTASAAATPTSARQSVADPGTPRLGGGPETPSGRPPQGRRSMAARSSVSTHSRQGSAAPRSPMRSAAPVAVSTAGADDVRTFDAPAVLCEQLALTEGVSAAVAKAEGYTEYAVVPLRTLQRVVTEVLPREVVLQTYDAAVRAARCATLREHFQQTHPLLGQCWVCRSMADGEMMALVRHLTPQVALPGEDIVQEGTQSPLMYFVRRGTAQVVVGGRAVPEGVIRAGRTFGEMSVLFQEKRIATVRAVTVVDLWVLRKDALDAVLRTSPARPAIIRKAAEMRTVWLGQLPRHGVAAALRRLPLFRGIPAHDAAATEAFFGAMTAAAVPKVYPGTTLLTSPSERCEAIVVVFRGAARSQDMHGARYGPGDCLGEHCLAPHRWLSAVAATSMLETFLVPRAAIEAAARRHCPPGTLDALRSAAAAAVQDDARRHARPVLGPRSVADTTPEAASRRGSAAGPLHIGLGGIAAPEPVSPHSGPGRRSTLFRRQSGAPAVRSPFAGRRSVAFLQDDGQGPHQGQDNVSPTEPVTLLGSGKTRSDFRAHRRSVAFDTAEPRDDDTPTGAAERSAQRRSSVRFATASEPPPFAPPPAAPPPPLSLGGRRRSSVLSAAGPPSPPFAASFLDDPPRSPGHAPRSPRPDPRRRSSVVDSPTFAVTPGGAGGAGAPGPTRLRQRSGGSLFVIDRCGPPVLTQALRQQTALALDEMLGAASGPGLGLPAELQVSLSGSMAGRSPTSELFSSGRWRTDPDYQELARDERFVQELAYMPSRRHVAFSNLLLHEHRPGGFAAPAPPRQERSPSPTTPRSAADPFAASSRRSLALDASVVDPGPEDPARPLYRPLHPHSYAVVLPRSVEPRRSSSAPGAGHSLRGRRSDLTAGGYDSDGRRRAKKGARFAVPSLGEVDALLTAMLSALPRHERLEEIYLAEAARLQDRDYVAEAWEDMNYQAPIAPHRVVARDPSPPRTQVPAPPPQPPRSPATTRSGARTARPQPAATTPVPRPSTTPVPGRPDETPATPGALPALVASDCPSPEAQPPAVRLAALLSSATEARKDRSGLRPAAMKQRPLTAGDLSWLPPVTANFSLTKDRGPAARARGRKERRRRCRSASAALSSSSCATTPATSPAASPRAAPSTPPSAVDASPAPRDPDAPRTARPSAPAASLSVRTVRHHGLGGAVRVVTGRPAGLVSSRPPSIPVRGLQPRTPRRPEGSVAAKSGARPG